MGDVSGFLTDPDEDFVFDNDELSNDDLPEGWPEEVRRAFWTATNAPTYAESQKETLRFATLLECHAREASSQETRT